MKIIRTSFAKLRDKSRAAESKLKRVLFPGAHRFLLANLKQRPELQAVGFGSSAYGKHVVPQLADLCAGDTVISAGVGEDISFDVELQSRTGVSVVLVDPTPRAIEHVAAVRDGTNHSYDLSQVDLQKIILEPVAFWTYEGTVKFWRPQINSHVSHSLVNLQGTAEAIEVPCTKLSTLMRRYGIGELKLLKLDIEGAEIEVLHDMLDQGIFPAAVLVEFDELLFASPEACRRVLGCARRLLEHYDLIAYDGIANCSFYIRSSSRPA
jgi:FkbM family methyltransferase